MARRSFSYTVSSRCPPTRAAAVLADIGHQRAVHPLIIDIREQPPGPGALRSYRIIDRLRFGPVHLRVTYTADLITAGPGGVVSVARQRLATRVRNRTRLAERDGRTEVSIEITVSAPRLLLPYVFGQAYQAHTALAPRLSAFLDSQ